LTPERGRKRGLIAICIGVGAAAAVLASAAGLGGLVVQRIGAESAVVADPFTDGATVTWGAPVYDPASEQYVVDRLVVSRDAGGALPIGQMRVTVADADGDALAEVTSTTTGTSADESFTLAAPLPVTQVGNVAVVFKDIDAGGIDYAITPAQIGTSAGSAWVASSTDVAIVDDPAEGAVLALAGDGTSVMHGTQARLYDQIDNAYAARLSWDNFFTGSTGHDVDPVTGEDLPATSSATLTARVEPGSTLWLDVDVAYGASDDDLDVTRVTCQLDAGSAWSTIELADCSSIDDDLSSRWISAESWTFSDPWLGAHTYAPGDHLNPMYGTPEVATVAGYGFHVEGGGSAWVSGLGLRGQAIGFVG